MESFDLELYRNTINESDLGIIVLDRELQILLWNNWMADHSGKSTARVLHCKLLEVCPEIDGSRVSDAIVKTLHTGMPAVVSNVFNRTPFALYPGNAHRQSATTDISCIQQALKIIPLSVSGQADCCMIQITDVSAAVKRETALEQQVRDRKKVEQVLSEERAMFIAGPTVVLTWTAAPYRRIDYISPNIELMLGYAENQFVEAGLDIRDLIHPDDIDCYASEIEASSESDAPYFEQEYRVMNAAGEYRWIYNLNTMNRDEQGKVLRCLGYLLDITDRVNHQQQVERQAYYDELTGLPNRRMFLDRLSRELIRARRRNRMGALFFIDLDRFKTINDTLGHEAGDLLLKQIAARLKGCLREEDTAARLGGDEFVVILSELGGKPSEIMQNALTVAEKVRDSLGRRHKLNGVEVHSTPSIGVVTFPMSDSNDAEDLIRFADTAMYRAKSEGRNEIRFFNPEMQKQVDDLQHMEKSLRRAIEHEEFLLHYQPFFDDRNKLVGAEALLRWQHPQKGWISPADFIPVAEETGMIIPLGEWVLEEVCRQLKQWQKSSTCGDSICLPRVSVNVSPRQYRQPDFVSRVKHILDKHAVDPRRLEIELTEGVVIADVEDTIAKMSALQSMGIRIAIDDFGTGYSSLAYLNRLPIDVLKIDQSFVRDISEGNSNLAIIGTIISMARHLGLSVIAEGVEFEGELEHLLSEGCRIFQGYLFSKPLPAIEFSQLFLEYPSTDPCSARSG